MNAQLRQTGGPITSKPWQCGPLERELFREQQALHATPRTMVEIFEIKVFPIQHQKATGGLPGRQARHSATNLSI